MPAEPLESLLDRLKCQLRRLASRSTCSEVSHNPDELINALWIRLTERPAPPDCNAEAWAVRTFTNLIRDRQRSCNRRAARDVEVMRGRSTVHNGAAETRLIQRELRWHIKRAVRRADLRRDHRCALWAWLRDSLGDFAAKRGIPRATAGVWAFRARAALRPHLEHLVF